MRMTEKNNGKAGTEDEEEDKEMECESTERAAEKPEWETISIHKTYCN